MDKNLENSTQNHQDGPHHEGPQNNIASGSGNNTRGMSDMMNESPEQKAGKAHGQKDEKDVQQDQRLP